MSLNYSLPGPNVAPMLLGEAGGSAPSQGIATVAAGLAAPVQHTINRDGRDSGTTNSTFKQTMLSPLKLVINQFSVLS